MSAKARTDPPTHAAEGGGGDQCGGSTAPPPRVADLMGSVELEEHLLVLGYLSAVAARLDERGIGVRALRASPSHPDGSPGLCAILTLDPVPAPEVDPPVSWMPARLRWEQDNGWSATLLPRDPDRSGAGVPTGVGDRYVVRYLPAQLVPDPVTVAHFGAALRTNLNTAWGDAVFRRPLRVERGWLIQQLARFALPEPR